MAIPRVFLLCFCISNLTVAQQSGIRNDRYEEDYGFLKTDTSRRFSKIKYLPVSESSFLSLGGEIRYQSQWFKNEDWGDGPEEKYLAFYTRFLFHGDFHYREFRVFGQLNSTFAVGRPGPDRSIDENRLGVHQLFFDYKLGENLGMQLTYRVGRQEMRYGSERLITVREGPNNRLSFDAAKVFYRSDRYGIDAFYARPVQLEQGVFDDKLNREKAIWSSYGVASIGKTSKLDHYYIGFEDEQASFNGFPEAREIRHSLGGRWWGDWQKLNFDLEALYQFGDFGDQLISAYTVSANLWYTLDQFKSRPGFGLKTEVISGDKVREDQRLNTFNPLFPRGAYFGLVALIGPANLIDLHPAFQIDLGKTIVFSADFDLFWRYSINDGIYGPNVQILYTAQSDEKKIGNQLGINLEYNPNGHLSIVPEFTWFQAQDYLKEVGAGEDVFFGALTVQYRY